MLIELERLSALHRYLMRKAASEGGLQMVHLEILYYLAQCNRYSNTTQALADYLGQTKGSISQSLTVLEGKKLIRRVQDAKDLRVFHLLLTSDGRSAVDRVRQIFGSEQAVPEALRLALESLLRNLQRHHGLKSFGICATCRFHQQLESGKYRCGLTQENLDAHERTQICREHDPE
ncbi:MAG: MarR family winged helix-turn-helix transcriptional regulator [Oligoflexus sp.]|jgi:DNA-binding MarR family transcriptional regulator